MASLTLAFATFGQRVSGGGGGDGEGGHSGGLDLMDRVERLAFNALPATVTDDMWAGAGAHTHPLLSLS